MPPISSENAVVPKANLSRTPQTAIKKISSHLLLLNIKIDTQNKTSPSFVAQVKGLVREEGRCVMYGSHEESKDENQQGINKPFNGPAKPLDQEGFDILQELCPALAKNGLNGTATCCDTHQLKTMHTQFGQAGEY